MKYLGIYNDLSSAATRANALQDSSPPVFYFIIYKHFLNNEWCFCVPTEYEEKLTPEELSSLKTYQEYKELNWWPPYAP